MNFVADESVDRQIVERLRNDGYSVGFKGSPRLSPGSFQSCTDEPFQNIQSFQKLTN